MKAYAVFAGGGVKGAAFAGCMDAAQDHKVEFIGYGGSSVGSLVALLGSIGYQPHEVRRIMVEELDYLAFLGNNESFLNAGKSLVVDLISSINNKGKMARIGFGFCFGEARFEPAKLMLSKLGLYPGDPLVEIVKKYIRDKIPALRNVRDITFDDLRANRAKPLRIVASDLRARKAIVFGTHGGHSVLDAVLASTCYPFVFRPVQHGGGHLVDGGLASNLPVFVFDQERSVDRFPLFAFDLVSPEQPRGENYSMSTYIHDLIETALSAGDHLIRSAGEGIYHIRVPVPQGIDAMKFGITPAEKGALATNGYEETSRYILRNHSEANDATSKLQSLQAAHAPPYIVEAALTAVLREIERLSKAQNIHAYVMLPAGDNTQMIVYGVSVGGGGAPKLSWEIPLNAGWSGQVRASGKLAVFDLNEVRKDPNFLGIGPVAMNMFNEDRRCVICAPISQDILESVSDFPEARNQPVLATLCVDTSTEMDDTGWWSDGKIPPDVDGLMLVWTDVIAKLLA